MADAVGLFFDEMQESVVQSNYLGFASLFAQSLLCKENINYSHSRKDGGLQLHLLYDLKTYKTSGILEVDERLNYDDTLQCNGLQFECFPDIYLSHIRFN